MTYNHKLIEDLSWVISSPSLVSDMAVNDHRLLNNEWFKEQHLSSLRLLQDEDKSPQRIQTYLSEMPVFKLGFYFEKLIGYWLKMHPRFEIIKNNVLVFSEKITIGELDFIIKDHATGKTIHLEVAVKFFLGIDHNENKTWLGPNLKDRLDLKLDKLLHQQIELSNNEITKRCLSEHGITIDQRWVLLKGRLFNKDMSVQAQNSWLSIDDFCRIKTDDSEWLMLDKTHWLAPVSNIDYNFLPNEILDKDSLTEKLKTRLQDKPVCVAKLNNKKETKRIFITPNDWEQRALTSLN